MTSLWTCRLLTALPSFIYHLGNNSLHYTHHVTDIFLCRCRTKSYSARSWRLRYGKGAGTRNWWLCDFTVITVQPHPFKKVRETLRENVPWAIALSFQVWIWRLSWSGSSRLTLSPTPKISQGHHPLSGLMFSAGSVQLWSLGHSSPDTPQSSAHRLHIS